MSGSAGPRSYTFKISAEGMAEFVQDLQRAAGSSDAAHQAIGRLIQASPQLASSLVTQQEAVDRAARSTEQMRQATERAAETARSSAQSIVRASDALGAMETRALAARRGVSDLRGAMELLGAGGGGTLGVVANYVGNFADLLGTAGLAAGRFEGALSAVSARLAAVAGVAALPLFLQSVGLGINQAGEAADSTATAMDRWNATLERLNPSLEQTATNARRAAEALARQGLLEAEIEYGRAINSRAAVIGRVGDLDSQIGRAESGLSAASNAIANANRPSALQQRQLQRDLEQAETNLRRLQEQRAAALRELTTFDRIGQNFQELRQHLLAPLQYGPFLPADAPPAAGRGGRPPAEVAATLYEFGGPGQTVFPVQVEQYLARMRDAEEESARRANQAIEAEERRSLERRERANERATDRITGAITDQFLNSFKDTEFSFATLLQNMQRLALDTVLRVSIDAAVRPVVSAGVSALSGALGGDLSGGGILSGLGQLTGLSGLLPSGGLAGITDAVGLTSGGSLFGIGTTAGTFAANPIMLSSLLGAGGLGALGGGLLAQVTGGNSTFGSLGGGLGAAAGMAFFGPPGALIGGLAGGALGGMLGGDQTGFSGGDALVGVSGGLLDTRGYRGKNFNGSGISAQAAQEVAALNERLKSSGLRFKDWTGGLDYLTLIGGGGSTGARNLGDALNRVGGAGLLEGTTQASRDALAANAFGTVTDAIEAASRAQTDAAGAQEDAAKEAERASSALRASADSIDTYLGRLLSSDASYSAAERLSNARGRFDEALRGGWAGDATLAARATSDFDLLLRAAGDMYSTSSQFRAIRDYGVDQLRGLSGSLRAFADGGLAQGWALVGERGPELVNFTDPGRVYTAQQTREMLALGDGGGDLRALRAEMAALRALTAGVLSATRETADTNRAMALATPARVVGARR